MSPSPISRSDDLARLREDGYEVAVRAGYLLVTHVPYVTPDRRVDYGTLVVVLTLSGDVTTTPLDHIAYFVGQAPSTPEGQPLSKVINTSQRFELGDGIVADHLFSSKPDSGYSDYYHLVTTYTGMLVTHAVALDPTATARTFFVPREDDDESPFVYTDSASARARINPIIDRLRLSKVAVVGLGGTGSYILDLIAKTPIKEVHLYDGDHFLQHNAFRAPGAASVESLRAHQFKVNLHAQTYLAMHTGICPHPYDIDDRNVAELTEMDFVFLAAEGGPTKALVVRHLEQADIPFVDVGIGVYRSGEALAGAVATTYSASTSRAHVHERKRIDFSEPTDDNIYGDNIQLADLNALNAALAVIKFKKHFGVYADFENEHYSAYTIDGNHLLNEDQT
jgi:hypothetical protein